MKTRFASLFILMSLFLFVACNKPAKGNEDDNNPDPGKEQVDPTPGENPSNPGNNTDDEELDPEVKDGDVICVTNPTVEKFLTEVTYKENDYSETHILDDAYGPTAPGKGDKPQKFTIRWKGNTEDATARLWEDDGWSREYKGISDNYLSITNLRPNANYHYEVKEGSTVLTSGSFKTTGHVYQLFFSTNVRNCRDLGGWKTKDGSKTVKYRKIYRGGRTEGINTRGLKDLVAQGIKAELDLRGHSDVLSASAFGADVDFCAPVIEEGYSQMLKQDQAKTRQCFEFIVKCVRENKPVYFHCSLGRDRTGTVGMICLGILGVDEGDISKEYELTQYAPHGWATSDKEKTKMTRKVDYKGAASYIWSLAGEGGSFADGMQNYLLSIGVSQQDIDDFRSLMLE